MSTEDETKGEKDLPDVLGGLMDSITASQDQATAISKENRANPKTFEQRSEEKKAVKEAGIATAANDQLIKERQLEDEARETFEKARSFRGNDKPVIFDVENAGAMERQNARKKAEEEAAAKAAAAAAPARDSVTLEKTISERSRQPRQAFCST